MNALAGDHHSDSRPNFLQLSKVIGDLVGQGGHGASHQLFQMVRRHFGCRATCIRDEDIPTAIQLVEARRPYAELLQKTRDSLKSDSWIRSDVMWPAVRRAFSDEPGTIREFERYIDGLLEVAQARSTRRNRRSAISSTRQVDIDCNVISFDRVRASRMMTNVFRRIDELHEERGEVVGGVVDKTDPAYQSCMTMLIESFERDREQRRRGN